MHRKKILSLILAGGKGSRLGALTRARAKPALNFMGCYRLIDFPLTNLHHSGLTEVWIMVQYRPHALADHLRNGRAWDLDRTNGGLLVLPPYESDDSEEDGFAKGNAEALYLQRELITEHNPDLVIVLSADHIYRADFRDLVDFHLESGADLSLMTWQAPAGQDVSRYSVIETKGDKITGFHYKPESPPTQLVGMEIFCCKPEVLFDSLETLHEREDKLGDYGDHLFPYLLENFDLRTFRHEGYWRDVGTVESYWKAQMELLEEPELLALDNTDWPFLTDLKYRSPARVGGKAEVKNSLLAPGSVVEGKVTNCVVGPGVLIEQGAELTDCVVLEGARVGSKASASRTIIDSGAHLDSSLKTTKEVTLFSPDPENTNDRSRVLS